MLRESSEIQFKTAPYARLQWEAERYRLWSLSEMLKFNSVRFYEELESVNWIEAWLPQDVKDEDFETRYAEVLEDFRDIAEQCALIGLDDCADEARRHLSYSQTNKSNPNGIRALGRVLVTSIRVKLLTRAFLWVRPEHTALIDNNEAFGTSVSNAFPSARRDIREAGNCLAADCGTGSVFHLMRAVEVALRLLAHDRRVTFPKGNIDQKQWGEILNQLKSQIGELVKRDASLWPSPEVREAQIRFYQEALLVFNAFNDVWRRHVSHAHDGAIYDVPRATSVWNETRRFMEQLAARISEASLGDEYWKSA